MSDNTTPVNMNVNKFLSKTDFGLSLTSNVVWPWPLTHFIRRGSCRLCHTPVDSALEHFIVTLDKSRIASLLNDPSFWCKRCSYCVYQHYTPEECDYCWLRHIRRELNGVSRPSGELEITRQFSDINKSPNSIDLILRRGTRPRDILIIDAEDLTIN